MNDHKPVISIMVAVAKNGIIGRDGDMPWRLSTDLKRFKSVTMGCPVIMGRKTYQSIGRPLPGRKNIIVSRTGFDAEGIAIVPSINKAIEAAQAPDALSDKNEIFIIGGGQIYKETLHLADKVYLTHVEAAVEGDTSFPELDSKDWSIAHEEEVPAGENDTYPTRYVIYQRNIA